MRLHGNRKLTVDFEHHRRLLRVAAGVGGLAAVDPCVLDDGVVDDESGSGRLRLQIHSFAAYDALTQRVEPFQPFRLTDSWRQTEKEETQMKLTSDGGCEPSLLN